MRVPSLLGATALVCAVSIGCSNTSVGPSQAGVPALPPQSSMSIPSIAPTGLGKVSAVNSTIAVTLAYQAVRYWTVNVRESLRDPAALFALCHNNAAAVALGDNSGYTWEVGNTVFHAALIGRVESDSARWSMTVSGGGLSNFTWYRGTSTITGNAGYWDFYDTSLVNGVHPAVIRMSYNASGDDGTFKVAVVNSADSSFGSYLSWTSSGTSKSFSAFNAPKSEQISIRWNDLTEAGTLENVATGEKACWDSETNGHADIPCVE